MHTWFHVQLDQKILGGLYWRRPPLKGWEPLSIRQSTGDFNKSLGPSALEFQQGAASELSQGEEKKSDNLQYNTVDGWVNGTNDSATKGLMF